ncbi:hypothetical protein AALP_AAs40498U000300 [Arabis alpina]|uniref:D-fructose-1,6-bisphosphate 1-phosphohydrolase n=1 Tax=Arabis alpina TaxID=50452 RepID=A0A087G308_ARAAL|nr:hypothetical protein AALP_AAs40498U000300 [Arabis alpina]
MFWLSHLVLRTGTGVQGFTLDPLLGEFILTHPEIKIPTKGNIYTLNEGNAHNWDSPTTKFKLSINILSSKYAIIQSIVHRCLMLDQKIDA